MREYTGGRLLKRKPQETREQKSWLYESRKEYNRFLNWSRATGEELGKASMTLTERKQMMWYHYKESVDYFKEYKKAGGKRTFREAVELVLNPKSTKDDWYNK